MHEVLSHAVAAATPGTKSLLASDSALIAVENKQLATTIRDYLQAFGVSKVDIVTSCVEARRKLEERQYSLCYIEFNFPAMGGADLVRFLRTCNSGTASALVTMLMAAPRKGDIFAARDAGSNEIISLPISTKHLMGRLNHMLHNPRPIIKAPEYLGPCRRRKTVEVTADTDRRQA